MTNHVNRKEGILSLTSSGWDWAIQEARRQLGEANKKAKKLRIVIRRFELLRDSGEKFPVFLCKGKTFCARKAKCAKPCRATRFSTVFGGSCSSIVPEFWGD